MDARLFEDRSVRLVGEPLLLDRVERPVLSQCGQRLVDAVAKRVFLLEDHAEVLLPAHRGELAHDRPVRHLDGRDEEGGREVDDDPVDLPVLEAGDGVVQGVVDRRVLTRLDVLDDVVVARRPHGRAQLRPWRSSIDPAPAKSDDRSVTTA